MCWSGRSHSCGQHWDPCSTHWLSRATALGTLPATKLLLCCTAHHDILSSFSFHFLPRGFLAGYCYHQLQLLQYLFLKIGVIKHLGHLSMWHSSKAPNMASHIGFLFNGPDLFLWKEICLNSTLFVWGRFCSCQWRPSISFMFPVSPLNADQPLKNNCSQTNWMPLDSLEKDCLSFEVYPIMMAGITKSNNCISLLCDYSIWCVLGSGAWWKETHPVKQSWTPLWMAPNVAQTR